MPSMPVGEVRTNVSLAQPTYEWLKQHGYGIRGMGELIDHLVLKERVLRPLEDRVRTLEAVVIGQEGQARDAHVG
jgi:hypothetical protein